MNKNAVTSRRRMDLQQGKTCARAPYRRQVRIGMDQRFWSYKTNQPTIKGSQRAAHTKRERSINHSAQAESNGIRGRLIWFWTCIDWMYVEYYNNSSCYIAQNGRTSRCWDSTDWIVDEINRSGLSSILKRRGLRKEGTPRTEPTQIDIIYLY